jgi:hypothetical protein
MAVPIVLELISARVVLSNKVASSTGLADSASASDDKYPSEKTVANAIANEDYLEYSICFDTDNAETIDAVIPPGYKFAAIAYLGTDGTAAALVMSKTYSTGEVTLTTTKQSVDGYDGIGVTFTVAITGGAKASYRLKFTRS